MTQESGPGAAENIDTALEIVGAPETSENFPNAQIVTVKEGDRFVRYALSRDGEGNLQGVEFEKQEYKIVPGTSGSGFWDSSDALVEAEGEIDTDGGVQQKYRIGPTYQVQGEKLTELEATLASKGVQI